MNKRPNSRATFSEDAQVKVGKQLLATKNSFSFLWGPDEGGVVVYEDDDAE